VRRMRKKGFHNEKNEARNFFFLFRIGRRGGDNAWVGCEFDNEVIRLSSGQVEEVGKCAPIPERKESVSKAGLRASVSMDLDRERVVFFVLFFKLKLIPCFNFSNRWSALESVARSVRK